MHEARADPSFLRRIGQHKFLVRGMEVPIANLVLVRSRFMLRHDLGVRTQSVHDQEADG